MRDPAAPRAQSAPPIQSAPTGKAHGLEIADRARPERPSPTPLRSSPVERHGRLRVRGSHLVDEADRPTVLRGVSLFWSQWQPQFYNASALQWLRDDWRATVIRAPLGVHRGGYLENPAGELNKIQRVIDAAIELGLYVIVDWHSHKLEFDAACEFFGGIAKRYGNAPNILYETWNEPLKGYGWAPHIKPYHEAVIASIRAYAPQSIAIAGTEDWSHRLDGPMSTPLALQNVVYAFHFYSASHGSWMRARAREALKRGVPIFVSEWGASEASGGGRMDWREASRWLQFLNEHRVSHVNWSIADKLESSAALLPEAPSGGQWKEQHLSASGQLVREMLRTSANQSAEMACRTTCR
jgi:endoglucanase